MKRMAIACAALVLAAPATAGLLSGGNILKAAKVVLKGQSVLKTGETKCGSSLALLPAENSLIDQAVATVRSALTPADFGTVLQDAQKTTETEAQKPAFCTETKAKKKGLLGSIGKAAKAIGAAKGLGL